MPHLSLGLNLDLYDSGVTLAADGKVVFAANEERYTRRKNQGGFPHQAFQAALKHAGVSPADIELIVAAGTTTPPLPMRLFPHLHDRLATESQQKEESRFRSLADAGIFHSPLSSATANSMWGHLTRPVIRPTLRRQLPVELQKRPIRLVEHHHAHAAGVYALSGFDEALVLTGDGMGDGLSFTVSRWKDGKAQRLWTAGARDSFGLFFEFLTEAMGFTPCRDEGKITGLAAHGDPSRVNAPVPFVWEGRDLRYKGPYGRRAVHYLRDEVLGRSSREDVAAWAQQLLETFAIEIAKRWLHRTKLSNVAVAGGIFANVKLNQRLHELPEMGRLFVLPNMGDGGLSVGALCAEGLIARAPLQHVFWGDAPAAAAGGSEANSTEIAAALSEGKLVARCAGPMEWGPRALGNRSIVADARDPAVVARLNNSLKRSDFMPFAPAMLAEDAPLYLRGWEKAAHAAEFMTVCFDVTDRMRQEAPAVVHVDGTARAQLVRKESNPAFYRILSAFKQRTGCGILLNTSFNMHEEPIVRTEEEAMSAFERAKLDLLVLDSKIVLRGSQMAPVELTPALE